MPSGAYHIVFFASLYLLLTPLFALTGQVRAGDQEQGATSVPTGGLVFTPDPAIEFDDETLTVSVDNIGVVYSLRNSSDSDRTILISFPLPSLEMVDLTAGQIWPAFPHDVNFVGFSVVVDGVAIEPDWEQRAIALGLDVTETVKTADLPLGPDLTDIADQIAVLDPDKRTELTQRGILQVDETRLVPAWTLKTTYFWSQTIEAGHTMTFVLNYTPVSGRKEYSPQALAEIRDEYCINEPTGDAIVARASRGGGPPKLSRFAYLMTQGFHWSKPSAKFRLIIEKADPTVVVATCMGGFAPHGAGNLQWSAGDFTPSDDLELLFVR